MKHHLVQKFSLRKLTLLMLLLVFLWVFVEWQRSQNEQRLTRETERRLTVASGEEVKSAIQHFQMNWRSLEAHTNPDVQANIATGLYLEQYGYARLGKSIYNERSWSVTVKAFVDNVRVLEYTPEQFKATACATRDFNEVTRDGNLVESANQARSITTCGVYVFRRQNKTWKLIAYFNTADGDHWEYAPEWLRELIGELPEPQSGR